MRIFRNSEGRTRRIVASVGIAAIAFAALTACSARGSEGGGSESSAPPEKTKVTKVAIVAPETEADHGWNQQGLAGAQKAADELGFTLDVNKNVGYDNTQQILTQVAEKGPQLVIAHASGFTTAAARASEKTGVPMLVVDNADAEIKGSVGVVTFDAQQIGYLGGIAAAMTTKTDTIAMLLSAEDINWFLMSAGYIQGARSVNPDIKITAAYIGAANYGDSAGGKRVANQVIAAGADVIMGMGDGATVGYLSAIEGASTPVKYIATIGDVSGLVKKPDTILTSLRWNFAGAYIQAIKDLENGEFAANGPYTLSLANGGFSLQDTPQLTQEVKDAVATAKKGIEDGSIKVETATSKDELAALINK